MPLGLTTMHGKWDGISMTSPQLHAYKHERPAYSTPQPVENIPSNNECRRVELRGAKVASFYIEGDEFICLPQVFDLFLKHLVGGLHTVYTKLKRLNITPVVCNVEQVRILRGLGAIQPGVNRCKLITRKDFEVLYHDCTQASRPGRPPKRYPMLPPTTDLMSHHTGIRTMSSTPGIHSLLTASDLNQFHKRMRLDQEAEKNLHQSRDMRMNDSPNDISSSLKDAATPNQRDMHANAASFYLQAQQALRQQYQQVATSSLQNSLDPQHLACPSGINPALAPFMMMSHQALFPGGIPQSPMSMLNHINQFAQNHGSIRQQAAAVQAAAQVAAAAQVSLAVAASASHSSSGRDGESTRNSPSQEGKDSDCEEVHSPRSLGRTTGLTNGIIGSDGCASPQSSVSSGIGGDQEEEEGITSDNNDRVENPTGTSEDTPPCTPSYFDQGDVETARRASNYLENGHQTDFAEDQKMPDDARDKMDVEITSDSIADPKNLSSMQTLLTNIQGLLKVAADNARLQDKHCTFEIADLKTRMAKEREIRGTMEKKLLESERIRESIRKRLKGERKIRKMLQQQLLRMQQHLGNENGVGWEKIASVPTTPINGHNCGRDSRAARSSPTPLVASVAPTYSPQPASPAYSALTAHTVSDGAMSATNQYTHTTIKSVSRSGTPTSVSMTSPAAMEDSGTFMRTQISLGNTGPLSPPREASNTDSPIEPFSSNHRVTYGDHESPVENREQPDHNALTDARMYFNSGRYQTTA